MKHTRIMTTYSGGVNKKIVKEDGPESKEFKEFRTEEYKKVEKKEPKKKTK